MLCRCLHSEPVLLKDHFPAILMYVLSTTVLVATNPYGNGFLYNGYQFEVQ